MGAVMDLGILCWAVVVGLHEVKEATGFRSNPGHPYCLHNHR